MVLSRVAIITGPPLHNYQAVKKTNAEAHKNYNNCLENLEKRAIDGQREKKQAITKLIQEFESAEKALFAAGAKTFIELHPDLPRQPENNYQNHYKPMEPLPYETRLSFQVPDLNENKRIGYHILFEAAWNNDIDTIKSLSLAPWESPTSDGTFVGSTELKTQIPPLKIAVKDGNGFSPFSIAVLRGHRDLARKIIDICITQYHKDDGLTSRQRWNMLSSDSDNEESGDGRSPSYFLGISQRQVHGR